MSLDWQNAVALVIVLGAVGYLVWHLWMTGTRKKPTGCGSCADCPAQIRHEELVSIEGDGRAQD